MTFAVSLPAPSTAVQAYRAMAVTFAVFGFATGLWGGAMPVVALQAGVSPRLLGLGLTAYMMAYLVSGALTGALARYGSTRRLLLVVLPAMAATLAGVLAAPSAAVFFLAFAAYGLFAGLLDVTINTEGTRIETERGRPILASLHGCASLGMAAGAIAGSLVAVGAGLATTAGLGAAMLLLGFGAVSMATPDLGPTPVRAGDAPPVTGRLILVLIGLTLGVSMAGEMAAATWSAPLLTTQAPAFGAYAGLGGALFGLCQAVVRFRADRLRRAFGDPALLVASLALALVGAATVSVSSGFALSALGFGLIGLGTACVVPCGFAYAVARSPLAPAVSLSIVAFATAFARLPSPSLVGEIAARWSIATAFGLFVALFALAIGVALVLLRTDPRRA